MDIDNAGEVVQDEQLDDTQAQADEQQAEGETPEGEQQAELAAQAEDDGEVVITIGDEAPPAPEDEVDGKPAPAWVKELRKEARELKKRNRELEQAVAARQAAEAPKVDPVGEKPTLESCDFDAEAYGEKLLAWNDAKRKADEMAAKQREEQEAAQAAWNSKLTSYQTAKASLKVSDFDDAEHLVTSTMSATQQAIILKLPKPELMVYAVGKNPAKAKELAAIKDPIDFAFAVAKLETQLKVQPRNAPPAPENKVRSTAGAATAIDSTLARLEAEADRTGDRTKIIAYKDEQRRKAAQAA
ncbi:hypothetical protein [Massilia sp. CT11-137]|uniref:hypothetical protein n=1 Tax=Massilia sp. CT11-137 TaxID=3393901 RepID=UPI0039AF4701